MLALLMVLKAPVDSALMTCETLEFQKLMTEGQMECISVSGLE